MNPMSDITITGTDSLITRPAPALYGFIAFPEVYVKSVPEAVRELNNEKIPHVVRSSDEALLLFIASRLGCPALESRRLFVPLDAIRRVDHLRDVQMLSLTGDAYIDYDEILAYIEGNRPDWVCFNCPSQLRATTFIKYFRKYHSLTPLLYIFRDGASIYVRYRSDAFEYDELTPQSQLLVQQFSEKHYPLTLTSYTESVLQARQERKKLQYIPYPGTGSQGDGLGDDD